MVSKLPEAEREVNEIDVLEKLATIYAAPGDPRCEEANEALVARGAHYGLFDGEVRTLLARAFSALWTSSQQRCLEILEQTLRLSAGQGDALLRARIPTER